MKKGSHKSKLSIGQEFESNNCGKVKLIEEISARYWKVCFFRTGTIDCFREDAIIAGCIKDCYAPLKNGVGKIGKVSTKKGNHRYYQIWAGMITRCYDKENKKYSAYRNVKVSERWLTFENFLNDCPLVDGWNEEMFKKGELVLDKDKKQRYSKNKIYSLETCTWLPPHENDIMQDAQMNRFVAISPSGEEFHDYNISAFGREHGLTRRHISGVLHGRAKTTGGWKFFYEEIV